ncbi:hypothetical protein J6590_034628 [Homalodisca vitripennis]|nr:hypothetical protein J6590_034628 [Homalodisca vitripennis]
MYDMHWYPRKLLSRVLYSVISLPSIQINLQRRSGKGEPGAAAVDQAQSMHRIAGLLAQLTNVSGLVEIYGVSPHNTTIVS